MRRFKVLGEMGRGGFGRVLRVVEEGSDLAPELALKLLTGAWQHDDDPVLRLRDEARLLARLRHPGIVRLHGYLSLDAGPGLLMELVDGPNLTEVLRRAGAVPMGAALEIIAAVAEALDYAGALTGDDGEPLRLRHRDITPGNVALTRHGEVKLLDFGIAWATLKGREARSGPEARGTGTYMAPERHAGRDSETVDVYGLGLVLFNLLTGKEHPELPADEEAQPAFRDALALRVMEALGARRRVSELVAALVVSCVEWAPDARPSPRHVGELARALAAEVGGPDLRAWAAEVVPGVEARVRSAAGVAVIGAVLSEVEGQGRLVVARTEVEDSGAWLPGEPISGVGIRSRAGLAVAAVALLAMIVAVGAWWARPDPAPPVALAQTAVERPPAPSAELVQPALAVEPPAPPPSAPPRRPAQIAVTDVTPAQSAAHVSVQGDATRVELLTRGEPIALPAEVAPGTYSVLVTFPNGDRPFVNGELAVKAGAAYEIRCLFAMLTCKTRELP